MSKTKIDLNLNTSTSNKDNSCPKCKTGKMTVTIQPSVHFFKKVQIFTSFCPSCGHTIKKVV